MDAVENAIVGVVCVNSARRGEGEGEGEVGDRTFGGASDIQLCVPYLDYKYLLYQLLVVL